MIEQLFARGVFHVQHLDASGLLLAEFDAPNLVVTLGKNDILDKYLSGAAYTAAFFVGLVSSIGYTAYAAGDTAAQINGTNAWKEAGPSNAPNYAAGTRPAPTFASAAAGSKATSASVSFAMNQAGTVRGAFMATNSTKEGTSGVLLSVSDFTGGSRTVANGDTLNVSWTLSI